MGDEIPPPGPSNNLLKIRKCSTCYGLLFKNKKEEKRLLSKIQKMLHEFATKSGTQAVVLVTESDKSKKLFDVFGTKPLENVVQSMEDKIMTEFKETLADEEPSTEQTVGELFDLPPLCVGGIPTPLTKMTQHQLRSFISSMLKYSTGRNKPRYGTKSTTPPWWPKEVPWANVRVDTRSDAERKKTSMSDALRKIIINCYKFHGREDLLLVNEEKEELETDGTYVDTT